MEFVEISFLNIPKQVQENIINYVHQQLKYTHEGDEKSSRKVDIFKDFVEDKTGEITNIQDVQTPKYEKIMDVALPIQSSVPLVSINKCFSNFILFYKRLWSL